MVFLDPLGKTMMMQLLDMLRLKERHRNVYLKGGFINEINIKLKHNINTHRKYDFSAASHKLKLLIKIYNYCWPTCLQPLYRDDTFANNG
jgi:hypothetical protein